MLYLNLYDNQAIDSESSDFKNIVAESVKNMILKDWDTIVHVSQYRDEFSGHYRADVKIDA